MRDRRCNEQDEPSRPAPLPPSPLTQVVEVEPFERLRLPWTTPLFTLLGALLPGPLLSLAFLRVHQDAYVIGGVGAVMSGARVGVLALGAVAADRLVPSWPRVARWALGMTVSGFVPGLELAAMGLVPLAPWMVRWLPWVAGTAVRDGLIGAIGGYLLFRERSLLWARCIGAAVVWALYAFYDFGLSGPLAELFSGTERVQFALTLALGGCLLPVAFALSLRLAWRRALLEGTGESQ